MIKEKIEKHLKTIIITIALMLANFAFWCLPSNAADYPHWGGDENGGMPSCQLTPPTGLFPQLLSERQFYGDPDTEYPYEEWKTDISKGVVYCANQGTILRFGKRDPNIYYPDLPQNYSDFLDWQELELQVKARSEVSEKGGYITGWKGVSISYQQMCGTPIDEEKPMVVGMSYNVSPFVTNYMEKLMGMLAGTERPPDLYGGGWECYNHPGSVLDYTGGAEFGPTVCVMEYGGSRGYGKAGSGTARNDQMAYILTAMEDVYNTSSPHTKYNEQDIQSAYWLLVDSNVDTSHCTGNGFVLKQRAEQYEKFVAEISGGYKASLDTSNSQVIVNQESEYFIVGPFSITYPEYQDLSYVKALYITTDTGKTLVYDEKNNDLEILCETGSALKNNGQLKTYPSSGEYFYIKFSAAKAGYPKDINLYVDFEYLSNTEIDYNDLRAQANIYQYFGYVNIGGEHSIRRACGKGSISYTYKTYDYWYSDPGYYDQYGNWIDGKDHYHWVEHSGSTSVRALEGTYSIVIDQPYVQMGDEPVQSLTGQPLTAALEGSRTYTIHEISAPIDLTFELGGKVWVDGATGKENS